MGSLELYTKAARHSAHSVIADYSTSFGLATRILPAAVQSHIKDVYALVRVADEIVDGAASEAVGTRKVRPAVELATLAEDVYRAMATGFSANLVVHAFAATAREVGITRAEIAPFFESMRMDLTRKAHTEKTFKKYVYGSAEVVGLMCLRAFVAGREGDYTPAQLESLELGALALGAAFQKINFLRDLQADFEVLGRSYFPGVTVKTFDEAQKQFLVDDIAADLIVAANSIVLLPKDVRPAVSAAQFLFGDLTRKISATPASVLIRTRIRVSNPRKLWLITKAMFGATPK